MVLDGNMNGLLIIAHAPLAHALRECALHVFPDCGGYVRALDVQPNLPPDRSEAAARWELEQLGRACVLVLTDVFGATPCNVAQRVVDGTNQRLVAGVNLPMVLRAVSYIQLPLEDLVARAVSGGSQGVMPVAVAPPQHQPARATIDHDQARHHHQQ